MMKRLLYLFRKPITSEVALLGGVRFRITRERGTIIGLEVWTGPDEHGTYGYTVWLGERD